MAQTAACTTNRTSHQWLSEAERKALVALRVLARRRPNTDDAARRTAAEAGVHFEAAILALKQVPTPEPRPDLVRERDDFGFPAPQDDGCQLPPAEALRRARAL